MTARDGWGSGKSYSRLADSAAHLLVHGVVYRVHRESGAIHVMTLDDYAALDNASDDGRWVSCLTLRDAEARSARIRGRS